jgi:hypothetical protein
LMAMRIRRYNAERITQYGRDYHEDQAVQTGFEPVWYSILRDYTKNYYFSVYFSSCATMKPDTSLPKKLIFSPIKDHLPLTPSPC